MKQVPGEGKGRGSQAVWGFLGSSGVRVRRCECASRRWPCFPTPGDSVGITKPEAGTLVVRNLKTNFKGRLSVSGQGMC